MAQMTMTRDTDQLIQGFLRKRGFPVALLNPDVKPSVPTKRMRQSRKVVSFSNDTDVYLRDYSISDLANSWYQKSDYIGFANDCRRVLRETDAADGDLEKIDYSTFCFRGLEDYIIPSFSYLKQKRRRLLIRLIVGEHQIQKARAVDADGEHLRSMSVMFSRQSRSWARELGALDAH